MSRNSSRVLPGRLITAIVAVVVVSPVAAYLALRRPTPRATPPAVVVVSVCQCVLPGMRRVSRGSLGDLPIKFDVPESTLTVVHPESDSPGEEIYYIRVKKRRSIPMLISEWRLDDLDKNSRLVWPLFSEHSEEREIRSVGGGVVGKDHWGLWEGGKRWRRLKFGLGEEAGYPPTPAKEADLFDRVISSACFSAAPTR